MSTLNWIRGAGLITPVLLLACFALLSCGDDGVSPDNGDGSPDMPDIPLPVHFDEVLPQYSDTLMIQEVPVQNFAPDVWECPCALSGVDDWWAEYQLGSDVSSCGVRLDAARPQTVFVFEDEVLESPYLQFEACLEVWSMQVWQNCEYMGYDYPRDCVPVLEERPLIQRHRYWKKIFSARITYPADYSESHSFTEGTSETDGYSFARTVGASAGIWGISLSASLTETFSHEVTVSSETTVEQEFSASSIEGKVVHFTAWQLIEVFRICNCDSSAYTDPSYVFGEIPTITNATPELYLSVVSFDQ